MIKKIRHFLIIFLDLAIVYISYIIALYIRFIEDSTFNRFLNYLGNLRDRLIIPILIAYLLAFMIFRVYSVMIMHVSIGDFIRLFLGAATATVGVFFYAKRINPAYNLIPTSVYIMALLMIFFMSSFIRASDKIYKALRYKFYSGRDSKNRRRVLIYGAGEGGVSLLNAFQKENQKKDKRYIVAFYDDDVFKERKRIGGLRIYGDNTNLVDLCEKLRIDEIIIAIPSATKEQMARILDNCKRTNCKLLKLPNLIDLIDYSNITLSKIQEVSITDLLGRKEVELDIEGISQYLRDEVVLVTGGGGSIGSELCQQIIKFSPKKIIIFDIYENNAYVVSNELAREYGEDKIDVVIGSVRDETRLREVFEKYKPGVVFHAAAHKHVPLMEHSPKEAVKNNVFGTYFVARASSESGVKKFVMISTDKAVNPTNIMGASKRIAEMVVMSLNSVSDTEFVAVRFGNVLGSDGSVIPLFKKQIESGGPVTVTDPNVIRYFMTIQEASKLVIQAGAMAKGGEIFILDMGEPVRILDLAEDLIKLSGYVPYKDIDIVFTGLRPGEKLYEELMQNEEGTIGSSREGIFVAKPINISYNDMINKLDKLKNCIDNNDNIVECIKEIVPTYQPSGENVEPSVDYDAQDFEREYEEYGT